MSRGLGKIEQAILVGVNEIDSRTGEPCTVLVHSRSLAYKLFHPRDGHMHMDWEPTNAQRKAIIRAMHSFVRKSSRYAIAGGQGRRMIYIYEIDDPLSAMWAKLTVESHGGKFICRMDAEKAVAKAS